MKIDYDNRQLLGALLALITANATVFKLDIDDGHELLLKHKLIHEGKPDVVNVMTPLGFELIKSITKLTGDMMEVAALLETPPITTFKPDRPPSSILRDTSAGVHPGFGRYDIGGEVIDFDQVINMNRVREHEAEDKRQEKLSAIGCAAEQRMAREELDAKWRERENEITAEMKKGLRDGE